MSLKEIGTSLSAQSAALSIRRACQRSAEHLAAELLLGLARLGEGDLAVLELVRDLQFTASTTKLARETWPCLGYSRCFLTSKSATNPTQ